MNKSWQNKNQKNLTSTILWLAVVMTLSCVLFYAVTEHLNSNISKLQIEVDQSKSERALISEASIKNKIEEIVGSGIAQVNLKELELDRIEEILQMDSRIRNVEAYINKKNILKVAVALRKPFVRINSGGGESYYLDVTGSRISTVKHQAVRVPIATGDIAKYENGWLKKKAHNLNEVFTLSKALYKDDFLYALVEQIDVDKESGLTLIPKVGPRLIIGDTSNLSDKLDALKASYEQVLKRKGWEKLKALNFSIPNQVRKVSDERVSALITNENENHKI